MDSHNIQSELASIRSLMERSTKFLSLSGLAGVLAGIYALIGGYLTYCFLGDGYQEISNAKIQQMVFIALVVLFLAVTTGFILTKRQAKKNNETIWNPVSKKMIVNMLIPLATGGLFILILLLQGYFTLIVPSCLIFYGLSLIAAGEYSFSAVKWMGGLDILLGILAAAFPLYGLFFWMAGFGGLHIVYGLRIYLNHNS
ncbi:MAG: hypothetical protein ACK45S_10020 [Sphingobacteriales bacterium]